MSWKFEELGKVCDFLRGMTYKPADRLYSNHRGAEAVGVVRTANVQDELEIDDLVLVPRTMLKSEEKLIRKGDIIISSANSWNLVGKCCQAAQDFSDVTFGGFVTNMRPNPEKALPRYVYHFFASTRVQQVVRSFGQQTTSISNLDLKRTKALEIPLPPLEEQRRIAGILDAADTLRRRRREALALLDTLPGAIFAEMFLNSGGAPEVPLHDLCRPKQWRTIKATELTETGYPVYGANGKIGFYSAYNHKDPTVLITCRGATCGTINVCEPNSYVTGNAMALDSLDESRISLQFLAQALRVRGVSDAITGTAQPQITRQSLTTVTIMVPDRSQQQIFERSIKNVDEQRVLILDQLDELETLFASLQSRAFAGEL